MRKCKCHAAWGRKGKQEQKWFILTVIWVVAIGIVGGIVITSCENMIDCRRLYPDPLRGTRNLPAETQMLILYPEQSEDVIPGDMRFTGNGELPQGSRYMAIPTAPDCWHLYDKPGKHDAWAECMGVRYNGSMMDRFLYRTREGLAPDCTKIATDWPIHEWRAHCMAAGDDKKVGAYR